MKRNFFTALLTATALLVLQTPASAVTSAASLDVKYALTDLDASDAVTPSFDAVTSLTWVSSEVDGCCAGPAPALIGFLNFAPFDYYGVADDGYTSTIGPGAISATAWGRGVSSIGAQAWSEFLLSPHTSVALTFDILLSATPGHGWASASVCLVSDISCTDFTTGAGSDRHTVSATFSNLSSATESLYVGGNLAAFATGVPEPSTLVMLALGVGALLRRARRA